MATVLAIGRGPRIFRVGEAGADPDGTAWGPTTEIAAARRGELRPGDLPDELVIPLRHLPRETTIAASGGPLASALAFRLDRPVRPATLVELRRARGKLPRSVDASDLEFVRRVAVVALERGLRAPEEILITLAREEERLERAVGREARAAESFLAVPGSPLVDYATAWAMAREALADHHARLLGRLEREARALLPNLSATVGPRVAARLLAAAGGLAALGRMRAPRLQLLGSRRRPSADHGPRFGVLFRAEGIDQVPFGRRGAYARSLAALGAIAARADASTHRDISKILVARRDRRIEQLRRGRR